jgi:hypothetical protein
MVAVGRRPTEWKRQYAATGNWSQKFYGAFDDRQSFREIGRVLPSVPRVRPPHWTCPRVDELEAQIARQKLFA